MDRNILSQREIDSLLSQMGGETKPASLEVADTRTVKAYDFRHPDKFSKDHIRALQTIVENFAHLAGSSLTSHMRSRVQIQCSSLEQVLYDEYVSQLPDPTAIAIISLDPLPDRAILEMNMTIFSAFFERLLGGNLERVRQITEVKEMELVVLKGLFNTLLASFKECWSNIVPLRPRQEEIVLSPQYIQSALPGGVAILAVFEISFFDHSGTMTLCVPHSVLEPVMAKLNTQTWMTGTKKKPSPGRVQIVSHQLGRVRIPVRFQLGETTIKLSSLMNLQPSDVICLDGTVDEALKVFVGKGVKYLAFPGVIGKKVAFKVTEVLNEGLEYG